MFGKNFRVAYPVCTRRRLSLKNKDALPNGMIAVKVWPIDTFKRLFDGEQLDEKIAAGYLLNDLAFYVDQGLLELWPRSECEVDQENQVLRWNGCEVAFDHFIDGERETPNLPTITRMEPTPRPYEYAYRDSFMGVMPRDLNNIYFVGLSRPTTGGLANVVEMQCLLVHRVLSDPSFHRSITSSIDARLKDYDRKYYPNKEHGPTDHLVWYGSYTDDIGRLLGIAPTLGKCRSLTDVLQYYFFPNGSLKFRCEGSYRVEGAKEAARRYLGRVRPLPDLGRLPDVLCVVSSDGHGRARAQPASAVALRATVRRAVLQSPGSPGAWQLGAPVRLPELRLGRGVDRVPSACFALDRSRDAGLHPAVRVAQSQAGVGTGVLQ
ncbi:MAG: hypothetical protein OXU20_34175 [Myxococcales bacterium]|nr:hypothetical protein [Myxococcales bacterium]